MTIKVGPHRIGTPPAPGIYAVTFERNPQHEVLSYWDGRSWGHGALNMIAAMQGLKIGDRLPLFKRYWRPRAMFWRTYENDGSALVDALKEATQP